MSEKKKLQENLKAKKKKESDCEKKSRLVKGSTERKKEAENEPQETF